MQEQEEDSQRQEVRGKDPSKGQEEARPRLNKYGMPTPIDPDRLEFHLNRIGYDKAKTQYLVDGFKNGFRLNQAGDLGNAEPEVDQSIKDNMQAARQKIDKEVETGRMMGPFDQPPFENFHLSPIKMREKSEKGKFRLIHNLSWPYDETSINGGIEDEHKSVSYSSVAQAIKLVMQKPKGSVTRKTDIKDAFKIIPVHPDEYHKLGLKFDGKYYYDVTLPMGGASSCQIFEDFSTALQAISEHDIEDQGITHYLDDFFFVDDNIVVSLANKAKFDALCEDLGVPQAPHKMTPPSLVTEFLGINIDSGEWKASLPQEKVQDGVELLRGASVTNKMTLLAVQSLVGKLSFASTVVPARAFLRRLIDKMRGVTKPWYRIKVTLGMLQDMKTWLDFMRDFNGVTFFRALNIVSDDHINMGADASKAGYGATFGKYWVQEKYKGDWVKMFEKGHIGITTLELYPILVLIGMFGHKVKNSTVVFHSDNDGVVKVLNKQSSSNKIIMSIVRPLVLLLMRHNIMLRSKHIPGLKNVLCDLISRFQATPEVLSRYGMKMKPEEVPDRFKCSNFKLR
jgi:hypothetical protein